MHTNEKARNITTFSMPLFMSYVYELSKLIEKREEKEIKRVLNSLRKLKMTKTKQVEKAKKTIKGIKSTLAKRINKNGNKFNNFILDNEISSELKNAFKKYNINYQCVPPKIHRRNEK